MEIYILRHAIAVPRGSPGYPDDRLRPLTPKGIEKMQGIARGMQRLGVEFDFILSSPYERAKHTAQIVAKIYHAPRKLKFSKALASTGNPRELVRELHQTTERNPKSRILLVGHEPYLSSLLAVWLGGPATMAVELKKGGLCKITVATLRFGPCAQLNWLLTPKQMILMAGG